MNSLNILFLYVIAGILKFLGFLASILLPFFIISDLAI